MPGLEEMLEVDAPTSTTPVMMAMMGCDSTAPDDMEARIVAEANRQLGQEKVFHSSMEGTATRGPSGCLRSRGIRFPVSLRNPFNSEFRSCGNSTALW